MTIPTFAFTVVLSRIEILDFTHKLHAPLFLPGYNPRIFLFSLNYDQLGNLDPLMFFDIRISPVQRIYTHLHVWALSYWFKVVIRKVVFWQGKSPIIQ